MLPRVVLDALMDHIQRYRVTTMFAVPALYRMILEHDRVDFYDLSSLRYCGQGVTCCRRRSAFDGSINSKTPLYQGYGTTEFCGAICMSYAEDGIPPVGSAGRMLPESRWKLVDPDTSNHAPGRAG